MDLVDLGSAGVVLVEGLEDDLLPRRVPLEVEGAGADGVPLVLVSELLDRLLRDDIALLVAHHAQEKDGVEGLQRDLHRVRVDHLDGLDHPEVDAEARAGRPIDLAIEAELDVLGRELPEALVELHALLELERPHRAIGREGPALGEIRLDLGRGDLAVLDGEAREPPVHEALDGLRLPEDARVRVERFGLLGRDVQHLLLLGLGRWRPDHREQGEGCEDREEDQREPVPAMVRHGMPPFSGTGRESGERRWLWARGGAAAAVGRRGRDP